MITALRQIAMRHLKSFLIVFNLALGLLVRPASAAHCQLYLHTASQADSQKDAVELHNNLMRQQNMRRIKRMTLDYLAAQPPEVAIPQVYSQVVRGHLFGTVAQTMDLDFQLNLRKHPLRSENGLVVMVSNLIPISPSDVGHVMHLFYNKLEILIQNAHGLQQVLAVASWSRHMVTEIQAGADCNTRAAQAVYNYVVARANVIHQTQYSLVDFWRSEVRDAELTVQDGAGHESYYLFSDGIKNYLNRAVLRDLDAYARAHGRRYLFFRNPTLNTAPASQAAVVLDYNGDLYNVARYLEDFNLEEWHTHRDFVLERLETVSINQIMQQPVFQAEIVWIQNWMAQRAKTPGVARPNPYSNVSQTLIFRRNAPQTALGFAPTQLAGAARMR